MPYFFEIVVDAFTYLWNVFFKLRADGFIQCPLCKLINHGMAFWTSNLLLQQVPGQRYQVKKTKVANEIHTLQHTLKVPATFVALVVQAPAYCCREQGGSHQSHLIPTVSADAKGPLKRICQKSVISNDKTSWLLWEKEPAMPTFRDLATSDMNNAYDNKSKPRHMGTLLILNILAVHLRVQLTYQDVALCILIT